MSLVSFTQEGTLPKIQLMDIEALKIDWKVIIVKESFYCE